jgi:hypothetical protein
MTSAARASAMNAACPPADLRSTAIDRLLRLIALNHAVVLLLALPADVARRRA